MDYLRNIYIPKIVEIILKRKKPKTDQEFIEFSQAIYDSVKEKDGLSVKMLLNSDFMKN